MMVPTSTMRSSLWIPPTTPSVVMLALSGSPPLLTSTVSSVALLVPVRRLVVSRAKVTSTTRSAPLFVLCGRRTTPLSSAVTDKQKNNKLKRVSPPSVLNCAHVTASYRRCCLRDAENWRRSEWSVHRTVFGICGGNGACYHVHVPSHVCLLLTVIATDRLCLGVLMAAISETVSVSHSPTLPLISAKSAHFLSILFV